MAVPVYSDAEYKKLKRKIDRYLLPLMWLCYGIQQTDKTSLGVQATFGLREVRFSICECNYSIRISIHPLRKRLRSIVSLILPWDVI